MNLRTVPAVAAALLLVAVGFALGRGCAPATETADPGVARNPSRDGTRDDDAAAGRRTPRRAAPAVPVETSPGATEKDESSAPPPPESAADGAPGDATEFPSADVEVVFPDGSPAPFAVLYARPAGQTSHDVSPQTITSDKSGRGLVPVVAVGRYDVGAVLGTFQALATDVNLPRTEPLKLVFQEPAVVTFHMPDRGGPAAPDSRLNEHRFRIYVSAESVWYPGRGETTGSFVEDYMKPAGAVVQAKVPAGLKYHLFHDRRFTAEPEEFVAPADVRFIARTFYPVRVEIRCAPAEKRFETDVYVSANFTCEESPGWNEFFNKQLPAGTTLGVGTAGAAFEAEFEAPEGTLRWQFPGVIDGSVRYSGLVEGARTPIAVTVELDPSAGPSKVNPKATVRMEPEEGPSFRVESSGVTDMADPPRVYIANADGYDNSESVPAGTARRIVVEKAGWAAAVCGDHLSPTVAVSETTSGEIALPLAQGGWLVIVPAAKSPEGLSTPRLVRADGKPFFSEEEFNPSCEMWIGHVVGPLAPGPVEFKVTIDGAVVATASAVVIAGRYEPLRIPRLKPR